MVGVVRAHPKMPDRREGMESAHAGVRDHQGDVAAADAVAGHRVTKLMVTLRSAAV
jgi:hypothetical protein